LLVASILVGILTLVGALGFGFSLLVTLTGYGIKIEDAVYFKQSDLVVTYSQENSEIIESYTVKIVNTTNKEFVDYKVRLTLFIVNGEIDHYPHASTSTQIISVKPNEEKVITLDAGFLTAIDLEGYIGESLELEYESEKATSQNSARYNQLSNGKDFNSGVEQVYIIICCLVGFELLVCLIVEIILIVKYNKSGKKLIRTMIEKK
jgi:hypothetical protein